MIDCPRRRVFLGDTPPPKVNCRCMHVRHSLRMGIDIACRRLWQNRRSTSQRAAAVSELLPCLWGNHAEGVPRKVGMGYV